MNKCMTVDLEVITLYNKLLFKVFSAVAPNGLLRYWQSTPPMDTVNDVFNMLGRMDTVAILNDGLYLIITQITFSVRQVPTRS